MKSFEVYELPRDRVVYNYRYFLPYAPEWGSEKLCEQRLHELLHYCNDAGIEAVQFFVNTLPATCYMPAHSAAEQAHRAKWMKDTVAPALRSEQISYQLNLQMLMGATTCGLDMRKEYGWELLVSEYGDENLGCACPLGPIFRQKMGEMLQLWAWTAPDVIWVDDDFRLHNHGSLLGNSDFYCYCDLHLDAFAEYCGVRYTRDTLLEEVLRPGEPSAVRKQWLDFLGKSMAETASWINSEVHSVSPDTRLALMTSAPDTHAAEGRNWREFLTALCAPHNVMTRPMGGTYTATNAPIKTLASSYAYMHQSIETLEHAFGAGIVDYGIEIENTRFTTWSKSIACTHYQMTVSQLCGCTQATLSLTDLEGSPIAEEPAAVSMLTSIRPRLEALASLDLINWNRLGVSLLLDPDAAYKVQTDKVSNITALSVGRTWPELLLEMAVPCKYFTCEQAAESGDVVALDGYSAWLASDDQLERILSSAALLDAAAAEVVTRRGFGHYLGVRVGELHDTGEIAEEYMPDVLPGVYKVRVPHRGFLWREIEATGSLVASEFIDPQNRRVPGCTYYENNYGGRIAVYAAIGDFAWGTFGSHARARWLRGVLRRLSTETFPVLPIVPHHCLTVVRQSGDTLLVSISNLGADVIERIGMVSQNNCLSNLQVLTDDGQWINTDVETEVKDDSFTRYVNCNLNVYQSLIFKACAPAQ